MFLPPITWIFLGFFLAYSQATPEPLIGYERITFTSGRVVAYAAFNRVFLDAEEALRNENAPVFFTETPLLIRPWERLLVIRQNHYYEGTSIELIVYDYLGNPQSKPFTFEGSPIIVPGQERILAGQRSSHNTVLSSFVLDKNGGLVATVSQPLCTHRFVVSDDEQVFWILGARLEAGSLVGVLAAYDWKGNQIHTSEFFERGSVQFSYRGTVYALEVPEPEMCG